MSKFSSPQFGRSQPRPLDYGYGATSTGVLASFFNMVYAWMAAGLALSAVVAWYVAHEPRILQALFGSGLLWILLIAELALVFVISYATQKVNAGVATALFLLYSAMNGLTLAPIFLIYTGASISAAFVVTAGMFGVMSVVGFVTHRDLSSMGSFLFMALIGLIIASVVNAFWANSALYWIVTYAGVLIFVGLTAYDTQRLRQIAYATQGNQAAANRLAINGSLALYLDFINLFLYMLRILGNRRD